MSDAAQPTAAEVRAAAEAVKAALDRHLAAVERRSGEDDPAVYEAFNELAAAAEVYDELLYDRYDEVTPFEIPGAEDALPAVHGPRGAERAQRADPPRLRRGRAAAAAGAGPAHRGRRTSEDAARGRRRSGTSVHAALGVLFGEFEPDEIASRHKEFGLEEGDSTLWVAAADEPAEPGEWLRPRSSRPTRSRWCAASTSAPSSTRSWTTTTTRTLDRRATRTPWSRLDADRCAADPQRRRDRAAEARPSPGGVAAGTAPLAAGARRRRSGLRAGTGSRVVRGLAGTSATARGSAWSTPCTTDRCRSPRPNAV